MMFSASNAKSNLLNGKRKRADLDAATASPVLRSATGWRLGLILGAWG